MNQLFEFIAEAFTVGRQKKWRNAPVWMWVIMGLIALVALAGLLAMRGVWGSGLHW
jgi:uncharacterized membrane protein